MSLLADPDVTGSIEPSADWEPCSCGSASEDTLGGWALILAFGISLIWGQKNRQRTNLISHLSICYLLSTLNADLSI